MPPHRARARRSTERSVSSSNQSRLDVELAQTVRRHALGWLVAANLVGVWLALVLVWPRVGDTIAPLTYGRWMPLHLNWQLYGWSAVPLIGVLMRWILKPDHPQAVRHARIALGGWSLALLLGGLAWLGGTVSGKLFLDWHGWARPLLPVAMIGLWTILAAHCWWSWRDARSSQRWAKTGVMLGLAAVPSVMWWVASREVYPAVNVDSGGATGAALLGSTLGIVGIFGMMPRMLGVAVKHEAPSHRGGLLFWGAYVVSFAVWLAINRGDSSHHDGEQIVGLGVLLAWVPLLVWWWRRFGWCDGARPWMTAALIWWAVLVVSGWVTFLPEISERMKFTNGLVAHAHLAMAGLVTSVNGVILNELNPQRPVLRGFGWWQTGAAVMVVGLLVMGWFERDHAVAFYAGAWWVAAGYGLRLAMGVLMALASVRLLGETRRP